MSNSFEDRERSTAELVREALEEARELARIEVALARDEVYAEIKALRVSAMAFGASAGLGILGIALLLVALGLALGGALPTLILGLLLMGGAGIGIWFGVRNLPKKPLGETRKRLETDVKELKERVA